MDLGPRHRPWSSALASVMALAMGCGSSNAPPAQSDGIVALSDGGGVAACATPQAGCSCTDDGATASCGSVKQVSGSYVTCSEGTRTCSGGVWGECVGEYVETKSLTAINLQTQGLNSPVACNNNPCDPTCSEFVDNAVGLDAGPDSQVSFSEAGVTIHGTPVPTTACTSLTITPSTSPAKDLAVTSLTPSPNSVAYTAAILPSSCYASASFLWSIDKYDVASIDSSGNLTLVQPFAGPITVTAYAGTLSASVVCNVTVNVVDTSNAPTGYTNAQFPTTTGATDTVSVLYPYPGTVFPLGLPSPLLQWSNGGTNASAVKVTLRFPATGTPIFSWSEIVPELQTAPTPTLTAQPRATIPQAVWNDFQQTVVRNSGTTGGDAVFAIQRYVGSTLKAEVPTTIHFANGQLKGSIFYNSYGTNLVQNFGYTPTGQSFGAATLEVAASGTSPTVVVGYNDPTLSGAGCRVCHNAAANGTRLISNSYLAYGSSGSATEWTTFGYNPSLGTPSLIQGSESLVGTSYNTNVFTYAALTPDGNTVLTSAAPTSAGSAAKLYSINGNAISTNLPYYMQAATPAFSSDGAHVAFNFYGGSASPLASSNADGKSLAMMDFTSPGTFSNFRVLYTPSGSAGIYSVWPAFLPAGQNGVVFQNEVTSNGRDWAGTRSNCDGSGSCNNIGATADIWWVSTGSTPTAALLSNLNGGSYLPRSAGGANYHGTSAQNSTYYEEVYNYEPTALPVTVGGYSWVAFTSRRLYGNVATIDPWWSDPRYQNITVQPTTKKIWIAAIANNPTPGTDPSYPAFYLPGQELLAGNSRAYFTLAACETPGTPTSANLCTSNLDCCGASASPPTAQCALDSPLTNPATSHCVSISSTSCVADGSTCSSDAQCCNFATGSRCGSGTCSPVPPINNYSSAQFVTTYAGACMPGQYPTWRFFYWQSNTPTGTSINFTAATSTDGVTWVGNVPIGTAVAPPAVTSTWTSAALTVDQLFRNAGVSPRNYLQVTATLNPDSTNTVTPILTNWQVTYDCPGTE